MKHFHYTAPESVSEVSRILQSENAVLEAGGTDLLGVLKEHLLPTYPDKVVSMRNVPGLRFIRKEADGLHIGAMTTLDEIASSPVVKEGWNALADAAYSVASPNIRTHATIGGNICQDIRCWYYRYPNSVGGRINCARKEGHLCSAMMGENRYHSIFGAAKVCQTPCTMECPAHTDISAYMEMIREGNIDGAARVILEVNPMPAITSRVCAHFCMEGCNRSTYDESLNVGSVERFLGDHILEHSDEYMKAPEQENGKKIAIVGSGPAGLTTAYYLRQSGYSVTVYERQKEPGGCLTYAIPAYRLPKDIVKKFISALEAMGIVFRCSTHVGEDITLEEIYRQHDSVMLDTGTWKRPLIGLAGEEMTRFGLEFLIDVNSYILDKPGSKVVVVGGGNVAMDVAITARRLGSESVKMVCLESREGMPANQEEIDRALEEQVEIINGWGPKAILKDGEGKVRGIQFKSCPRVLDDTGRFNPVYDEDNVMELDADIILMAIGQRADLSFLDGAYKVETERGRIKAAEGNSTSVPGIFAGGDVTTGPATVVKAVAAGKATALSINQYCGGPELEVEKVEKARPRKALATFDSVCHTCRQAQKQQLLPPEERAMDKEDMAGLTAPEAKAEAARCFNCGCLAVNPSDIANMLLTYDAIIRTSQRTLTAAQLLAADTKVSKVLRKGEVVLELIVPPVAPGTVAKYDKYRTRKSIDFAILAIASLYTVENGVITDARITMGAVAPVPMRATKAEQYLIGKKPDAETAAKAAELALEGAIPLERNAYKIDMAKVMIRRSLEL
ncbi:FAD-dependent oxidoreductase [Angelakisella massiliensis]|uniref:FAD-dependent oxidoreductase n=1 Tax=Angelakisella massiliensis TaxID=1871018 RepID=UPI0008F83BD6|nr:FAD-dependent oxidoreductase [Angelakisella massiliensis]